MPSDELFWIMIGKELCTNDIIDPTSDDDYPKSDFDNQKVIIFCPFSHGG